MTDVRLMPLDRSRLPLVRHWILDDDLRELIGTVRPPSDVEHERWFERLVADPARLVNLIVDADGEGAGLCGLNGIDLVSRRAELWIYVAVGPSRGAGHAAVRQQLAFAFGTLGLHRVFVRVFAFNERAHRFFESCGFQDEGVERDGVFKRGTFHDVFVLSMLADDPR